MLDFVRLDRSRYLDRAAAEKRYDVEPINNDSVD